MLTGVGSYWIVLPHSPFPLIFFSGALHSHDMIPFGLSDQWIVAPMGCRLKPCQSASQAAIEQETLSARS